MRNRTETTKTALLAFLEKLDSFLDTPIILIALGGTALTLLDIKLSTRDIDLIISSKDAKILLEIFGTLGFKEIADRRWLTHDGLIIDLYFDDYIINVKLLDPAVEKSTLLRTFSHITLRILNLYDICITKIDRGDARDFADIQQILKKIDIKIPILIRKYILTMDHSDSEHPKYKLQEFVRFAKEQGHIVSKEEEEKIRQWQRR